MSKYEHKLRPEKITTGKKGTVIWPAMFFEPPKKLQPENEDTVVWPTVEINHR